MKMRIVVKFGGTSVSSFDNWKHISNIVRHHMVSHNIVIVISALTGVTDKLVSISSPNTSFAIKQKLIDEIYEQHRKLAYDCGIDVPEPVRIGCDDVVGLWQNNTDYYEPIIAANICAYGELLSTRLGIAILNKLEIPCKLVDTRDIIKVEYDITKQLYSNFLDADINHHTLNDVKFDNDIVLAPGFICSKKYNGEYKTCLLGRGGSDTCGSLFAYITNAKFYEIYTDVNGIYDSDPNKNKHSKLIEKISYDEAYDMALNGAKVIHSKCIPPLKHKRITCIIKNVCECIENTIIS